MKNPAKLSEAQYHAMKLKNLQSALLEGEKSGDAGIFYIRYTHQVIALYFAFLYRDLGKQKTK